MLRIAVLGANGQVGVETCLLLRQQSNVEVVPICRNRFGSCVLRYHGMRCRHGSPANESEAAGLIADCDVVVNFALGAGRPDEARRQNRLVIEHATRLSAAHAKIIYFSTQSVYGNPHPDSWFRWRTAYGREKLLCERWQRKLANRCEKQAFVLRLGHVCGQMQNISNSICEQIAAGSIVLAGKGDAASNTVQVATIAEAIMKIGRGCELPGTYDLMNNPQWSWKEVYQYYAETNQLKLQFKHGDEPRKRRNLVRRTAEAVTARAIRIANKLPQSAFMREAILKVMPHLPATWSENIRAKHYRRRAAREIADLTTLEHSRPSFVFVQEGRHFLRTLTPTVELLGQLEFQLNTTLPVPKFPNDLQYASK